MASLCTGAPVLSYRLVWGRSDKPHGNDDGADFALCDFMLTPWPHRSMMAGAGNDLSVFTQVNRNSQAARCKVACNQLTQGTVGRIL